MLVLAAIAEDAVWEAGRFLEAVYEGHATPVLVQRDRVSVRVSYPSTCTSTYTSTHIKNDQ